MPYVLIVPQLADIAINLTVATVLFLDLPKEVTLTKRLKRYQRSSGWRCSVARFVCQHLLNPFDPDHC